VKQSRYREGERAWEPKVVILVAGGNASYAAKDATQTIPIVVSQRGILLVPVS